MNALSRILVEQLFARWVGPTVTRWVEAQPHGYTPWVGSATPLGNAVKDFQNGVFSVYS